MSIISFLGQGQISDFKEKFNLPTETKETSGLLFFNGKIITHNDSGDAANLYEIDSLSGKLLRTVFINNAINVDWEDITEDENYIYIGDFGNNIGTRTDLKIYKILKSYFKSKTSITADVITFSYEDQKNFNSSDNHNFDAEAFVIYENSFLIFTKNRGDLKTNVYKFPTTVGNHVAKKISSANVDGLITGATYNGNFLLCGYSTTLTPFLVQISSNRAPGDDIFSSGFTKKSLASQLGPGSQVEGIASYEHGKYYISREFFSTTIGGQQYTFQSKLYEFYDARDASLSTEKNASNSLTISPNPAINKIIITSPQKINSISIYNSLGKKILEQSFYLNKIDINHLSKGVYLLKIIFDDKKSSLKKIIKL